MYRYIGNKTKALPSLLPIITAGLQEGSTVADLMCGTASVSAALRSVGFKVVAADVLTFAAYHAQTRLLGSAPSFRGTGSDSYQQLIERLNASTPTSGYFVREYSADGAPANGAAPRKYLTGDNAAKLDAISVTISAMFEAGQLAEVENAVLRHDLVMAVNRVANIAGTYGHFRADFSASSLRDLELRPSSFDTGNPEGHRVLQGRVEDLAAMVHADVVYLDPPYKKRQYAANYHLLETVAQGDEAPAVGISGLRDWWPQYSDFCSKLKIGDAFRAVFEASPAKRFMVSYSEDGLLSESEMTELLSRHGRVVVHKFSHTRFKSNQSNLPLRLDEFVFEIDRR